MACKSSRQICPLSVFLSLVLVSNGEGSIFSNESCQKIDACSCVFSSGKTIDLHFSDHSQDGVPIFYYQSSVSTDYFKYSPCKGLPCGKDPKAVDASLCMAEAFQHSSVEIGTESSASFLVNGGNVTLVYSSNVTKQAVTSHVRLQCSPAREQFQQDSSSSNASSAHYNFTLYSRCACPGLCAHGRGMAGQLSAGSILLLVFFSALILYFVTGCVYRKAVYRGEKCADMVPHQDFWLSLPSLIKEGYLFFISPCIGNRAEYRTYDRL